MKYLPLTAGEVCNRTVVFADAGMSIDEASRLMRARQVGSLVVVEERSPGQRFVTGIVTDRDIVTEVVALERDPKAHRVGDVMRRDVVTARADDSVLDLLEVMRRKRVRRLPVTGARGELVGMLALDDVVAVVGEQMQALTAAFVAAQHRPPEA